MIEPTENTLKRLSLLLVGLFFLAAVASVSWTFPAAPKEAVKIEITIPPLPTRKGPTGLELEPRIARMKPQEYKAWVEKQRAQVRQLEKSVWTVLTVALSFLLVFTVGYLVTHAPRGRIRSLRSGDDDVQILRNLQASLQSASKGLLLEGSYGEVVRDCYLAMLRTFAALTGKPLPTSMTAHELCSCMKELGFTTPAIGTLTEIYERTRYQNHSPTDDERREASGAIKALMQEVDSLLPAPEGIS